MKLSSSLGKLETVHQMVKLDNEAISHAVTQVKSFSDLYTVLVSIVYRKNKP